MISALFLGFALSAMGQADPHPVTEAPAPWAEFSRHRGRGIGWVRVSIGTVDRRPGEPALYWATRTEIMAAGATDSVRCPALAAIVAGMNRIPMPTPVAGSPTVMIGDGAMYSLTMFSTYSPPNSTNLDRVTITSGGGPLAGWIDDALNRLESCWTSS